MKKVYVTPECTAVALPAGRLMQTPTSPSPMNFNNETTTTTDKGGWSNSFSGGIVDDTQGGGLWDEEN